VESPKRKNTSL
jgi:hypothetical protein